MVEVKLVTDPLEYFEGIMAEISRLKKIGRHTIFRPHVEMTEYVLSYLKINIPRGYELHSHKCMSCTNTYEIMITW